MAIQHHIDSVERKYIPYWVSLLFDYAQSQSEIYFLLTSQQYNVVLHSQNGWFILIFLSLLRLGSGLKNYPGLVTNLG